ncbi:MULTISPECIES: hypothetical protein [Shouchella]|uniref:Flagellar protein FliT n=1 Tax=Shouchella hunanensis TaxID=766894 RepID=A0ABY7W8P6_9BACI|nr:MULTISPECIES: hypothetical protein [Shouchella]WDF04441.1 hypothetical protein PQ477_02905 [Shouchella hunanensis]GAF21756.1 hypothetical protein JCM19047_1470 [Bacillus sp. JCM 19047]
MTAESNPFSLLTKTLLTHLETGLPSEDDQRDAYIDQVMQLLNERQQLIEHMSIDEIKSGFLEAEEKKITEFLSTQRGEVKQDIQRFNKQKDGRYKYQRTHAPTQAGVFLDKTST